MCFEFFSACAANLLCCSEDIKFLYLEFSTAIWKKGFYTLVACSGINSGMCSDTSQIIKAGNYLNCVLTSLLVCVLTFVLP